MGWLGWDWDQIRGRDVNVLLLALEGREELLKAIFGGSDDSNRKPRPMSPESFKAFAAKHNQRYASRSRRRVRSREG
jgi:hypothetical protein